MLSHLEGCLVRVRRGLEHSHDDVSSCKRKFNECSSAEMEILMGTQP